MASIVALFFGVPALNMDLGKGARERGDAVLLFGGKNRKEQSSRPHHPRLDPEEEERVSVPTHHRPRAFR